MQADPHKKIQAGLSLMEVIISLAVIMVLTIGIYSLIIISLNITADNKFYVEATEIMNQKMEIVSNLPYSDVGTLTGSPVGILPEYETVFREGAYTVHTTVMFYDNPFDGTISSSTDNIFVDYKIVTVEVSWESKFTPKSVTAFSKIIPNTEETLAGYGLLKLFTVDSMGSVVPNANIHIENATHGLSVDLVSDLKGVLDYPVLPDFEGYKIIVTKASYGTDQT